MTSLLHTMFDQVRSLEMEGLDRTRAANIAPFQLLNIEPNGEQAIKFDVFGGVYRNPEHRTGEQGRG